MPKSMPPAGRLGRWLALGLVLMALWNPPLPLGNTPLPLHLTLLVDQSASMERGWLNGAWTHLREALGDLPQGSRVSLVRYAADRQLEWQREPLGRLALRRMPQSRPLDTTATDLSGALRIGAALRDPARLDTVLLLSDGRHNRTNDAAAPAYGGAWDMPLLWWRPPVPTSAAAAITALHGPTSLGPGEPLTLLIEIQGRQLGQSQLRVAIDGNEAAVITASDLRIGGNPIALPNPGAGLHRIEVYLTQGERALDRRQSSVHVEGLSRVLVLSAATAETPLAVSLRTGGWPVTSLSAEQASSNQFEGADVVVLDDIAVADLPASAWETLAQRVNYQGLGLIVLGGPRSFSAGGYRDSLLEELLPVTAEAPEPLPAAAVLFLVDQSGSMGRSAAAGRPTRLALARRAVLETARTLQPGDLVGLITFAMQPQQLVALAPQDHAVAALEQQWDLVAQGGTRLAPALRRGLELLSRSVIDTRLLVVVTDGVLDEPEELMQAVVDEAGGEVRIIALAVGADAQIAALERLAAAGAGAVLPVVQSASLPRLMQQTVEQARAPLVTGPVQPAAREDLPFFSAQERDWPPLRAYNLAKPRPEAKVYVAAPRGDPLLASWQKGTGRVITLPGGLGNWAAAWQQWSHWGALAGGLVEWAAVRRNPNLYLERRQRGTEFEFALETIDDTGQWLETPPDITLIGPAGAPVAITTTTEAPGLYRLYPQHRAAGRHDLTIWAHDYGRHYPYLYEPVAETAPATPVAPFLATGLDNGNVTPWHPKDGWPTSPGHRATRGPLTGLAMLAIVLTLIIERGLHHRALQLAVGITTKAVRRLS